jgi:hypothetical protein
VETSQKTRERTPPCIIDHTSNDSPRTTPSHMPQPHSPPSSVSHHRTPSPPTINLSLLTCTDRKGKGKQKESHVHPDHPARGMLYTCPIREQAGLETTDKLRRAILLNATLMTEREMEDHVWRRNE